MKILPQRAPEQLVGDPAHLAEPQPEGFLEFRIPPLGAILLPPQFGIVRIGHVIDIGGGQPGDVYKRQCRPWLSAAQVSRRAASSR